MAHILVIEDDPELQELLARSLRAEGYEVSQASDGKRGVELALTLKPDLILLDMMLPEMNGMQVISRLKGDSKSLPIIVMTAFYSDVEFMEDTLRGAGAIEYLRKPMNLNDLSHAVRTALSKR